MNLNPPPIPPGSESPVQKDVLWNPEAALRPSRNEGQKQEAGRHPGQEPMPWSQVPISYQCHRALAA